MTKPQRRGKKRKHPCHSSNIYGKRQKLNGKCSTVSKSTADHDISFDSSVEYDLDNSKDFRHQPVNECSKSTESGISPTAAKPDPSQRTSNKNATRVKTSNISEKKGETSRIMTENANICTEGKHITTPVINRLSQVEGIRTRSLSRSNSAKSENRSVKCTEKVLSETRSDFRKKVRKSLDFEENNDKSSAKALRDIRFDETSKEPSDLNATRGDVVPRMAFQTDDKPPDGNTKQGTETKRLRTRSGRKVVPFHISSAGEYNDAELHNNGRKETKLHTDALNSESKLKTLTEETDITIDKPIKLKVPQALCKTPQRKQLPCACLDQRRATRNSPSTVNCQCSGKHCSGTMVTKIPVSKVIYSESKITEKKDDELKPGIKTQTKISQLFIKQDSRLKSEDQPVANPLPLANRCNPKLEKNTTQNFSSQSNEQFTFHVNEESVENSKEKIMPKIVTESPTLHPSSGAKETGNISEIFPGYPQDRLTRSRIQKKSPSFDKSAPTVTEQFNKPCSETLNYTSQTPQTETDSVAFEENRGKHVKFIVNQKISTQELSTSIKMAKTAIISDQKTTNALLFKTTKNPCDRKSIKPHAMKQTKLMPGMKVKLKPSKDKKFVSLINSPKYKAVPNNKLSFSTDNVSCCKATPQENEITSIPSKESVNGTDCLVNDHDKVREASEDLLTGDSGKDKTDKNNCLPGKLEIPIHKDHENIEHPKLDNNCTFGLSGTQQVSSSDSESLFTAGLYEKKPLADRLELPSLPQSTSLGDNLGSSDVIKHVILNNDGNVNVSHKFNQHQDAENSQSEKNKVHNSVLEKTCDSNSETKTFDVESKPKINGIEAIVSEKVEQSYQSLPKRQDSNEISKDLTDNLYQGLVHMSDKDSNTILLQNKSARVSSSKQAEKIPELAGSEVRTLTFNPDTPTDDVEIKVATSPRRISKGRLVFQKNHVDTIVTPKRSTRLLGKGNQTTPKRFNDFYLPSNHKKVSPKQHVVKGSRLKGVEKTGHASVSLTENHDAPPKDSKNVVENIVVANCRPNTPPITGGIADLRKRDDTIVYSISDALKLGDNRVENVKRSLEDSAQIIQNKKNLPMQNDNNAPEFSDAFKEIENGFENNRKSPIQNIDKIAAEQINCDIEHKSLRRDEDPTGSNQIKNNVTKGNTKACSSQLKSRLDAKECIKKSKRQKSCSKFVERKLSLKSDSSPGDSKHQHTIVNADVLGATKAKCKKKIPVNNSERQRLKKIHFTPKVKLKGNWNDCLLPESASPCRKTKTNGNESSRQFPDHSYKVVPISTHSPLNPRLLKGTNNGECSLKMRFHRTSQSTGEHSSGSVKSEEPSASLPEKSEVCVKAKGNSTQLKKTKAVKTSTRTVINVDELMKNKDIAQHAFTLWKSDKGSEVEKMCPGRSPLKLLAVQRQVWNSLSRDEVKKYLLRVLAALTDENKHSPGRLPDTLPEGLRKSKPDINTNEFQSRPIKKSETENMIERKLRAFRELSITKQHHLLKQNFTCVQRMLSKTEYTQFSFRVKYALKSIRQQNKTLCTASTQEEYEQTSRDVMFEEVLQERENLKQQKLLAKQEARASTERQFESCVSRLISGGDVHFDPSVRCQDLRQALLDLQELEKTSRVCVCGDLYKSESFECLVQDLQATGDRIRDGHIRHVSAGGDCCPSLQSQLDNLLRELPTVAENNTYVERLLQENSQRSDLQPLDTGILEDVLVMDTIISPRSSVCHSSTDDKVIAELLDEAVMAVEALYDGLPCCELNTPSCILSTLLVVDKIAKGETL